MTNARKQPNIVIIMVDQQRYDCLGYSKDYPVHTPHLDALAAQGMWFEQAYTPIPLCSPARQAFIAGRRAEALGTLWNYDLGPRIPPLEPDVYAWPRGLQALGYKNGYIGKWHVHPAASPAAFGYDEYISEFQYEQYRREKYPDTTWKEGFVGEVDPVPLEDTETHWLTQQAIDRMKNYAADGGPWHLRLDLREPHLPCRPAEPFASMYHAEEIPMWRSFGDTFDNKPYIQLQQLINWEVEDWTWEQWAPIVARYYGIISQVDDAIGRFISELDRLGLREDTLVIYTTDHGDMCGGHRMMDKHYVLYDDIVHVPMIVRWPGVVTPGSRCDAFVYNMLDLPPTLLEAANCERVPDFMTGRSLMDLLEKGQAKDWREEVVATYNGQQFGLYTQRMIRTKEWKLIWNLTDVDELYHLTDDPDELHNSIHDPANKEMIAYLRHRLYDILSSEGDTLVQNQWMRDQLLRGRKR
ncbi:sulfatase-like hydrolase/transferase [Paenibacillus sp. strain BS8-2]